MVKACLLWGCVTLTLSATLIACSNRQSSAEDKLGDAGTRTLVPTNPLEGPAAGYADGQAPIPAEGQAEDVSSPTTVIGTGTSAGCNGDAFVAAVAKGGVITFDCGPDPVTIFLSETARVFNDKGTKLVIDGGNKVTLSGGGTTRILYMATCDKAQVYPPGPGDCNTNPGVQLVVQNLTFIEEFCRSVFPSSWWIVES